MGASEGAKFVIVCVVPSSVIRKFSFFNPGRKFPLLSVITTSTFTTGTVTEMEKPPGVSAGVCGCCLSCLSFVCAQTRISAPGSVKLKMSVHRANPRNSLVRMYLINLLGSGLAAWALRDTTITGHTEPPCLFDAAMKRRDVQMQFLIAAHLLLYWLVRCKRMV